MLCVLQQNVTSKRMEYKGDLVDKLMAVSDAGSGGQVIIDGPTLEQLADKTFSLARLVPPINPCLPSESPECVRCAHNPSSLCLSLSLSLSPPSLPGCQQCSSSAHEECLCCQMVGWTVHA